MRKNFGNNMNCLFFKHSRDVSKLMAYLVTQNFSYNYMNAFLLTSQKYEDKKNFGKNVTFYFLNILVMFQN